MVKISNKNPASAGLFIGAGGGTRTHTPFGNRF
jgi:hypothetical protein